jgi:ubiquinone/menaquinone biosynthesis C-methylase UbiE
MKRPVFIARQSARPTGLLGRLLANIMAHETAALNERAVRLVEPSPSDWVLEIGFGHGRTVERLVKAVPQGRVCGLDVSPAMLDMAVRRNRRAVAEGRVELRMSDAASIPFADQRFDKALTVHTLYFWSDPIACLREIRRVLKPRGRLVLGFLRGDSVHRNRFPNEIYTFHDEQSVGAMLESCDFELIQFSRMGEASLAVATAIEAHARRMK